MQDIRYEKYICSNCGVMDTVALSPHEPKPGVINCWKCHAGFQKSTEEQYAKQLGMFPVEPPHARAGARR
jgi:hypothetical protein